MKGTANPAADFTFGLGGAKQGGGGNWLAAGVYDLEIVRISRKISDDKKKRQARIVITEARVAKVITSFEAGDGFAASNKEGEYVSIYVNLDSAYPDMDKGRLVGVLEAALGPLAEVAATMGCPDDVDPEDFVAAAMTEPPGTTLAGVQIRAVVTRKITRGTGSKIAAATFTAVPAE